MRILYDARSVQTPSGLYVFQGLTAAWANDSRVERVVAAVRPDFDRALVPLGVEPISTESGSWLAHVSYRVRRLADGCHADVIFAPNGMAPRDARSVAYFQDLFHFRTRPGQPSDAHSLIARHMRAAWRTVAAPTWMLAVPVSTEIAAAVKERVASPSVLIPNGVDVGAWRWTGEEDSVFVMGGIGDRKDETTAIRAWRHVRPAARGNTVLRIGGVEPAARRVALQAFADSQGIIGGVSITGAMTRDAYLESIARARLAVSCSTFEAFGLPVAEALALGAPLMASAIPSHLECMARAGVGEAFAAGNAEELAQKIEGALRGHGPQCLRQPPTDWSWASRGKQHVDAYSRYL